MNDGEWEEELRKMIRRSQAVNDFVAGRIDPSDLMDALHENGVDVLAAADDWDEGICYL